MNQKYFFGVIIALNLVVLAGQIWPEGAPPFAPAVNIAFLIITLAWFLLQVFKKETPEKQQ